MRAAFTVAILCLAVYYTYVAFVDLNFLSSTGRLGPGFFPRIVGVLLILACLYELAVELRRRDRDVPRSQFARVTLLVAVLSGLFVLSLEFLGGPIAMVVFMLVSLFILNRGHPVQNVVIGTILPLSLYLLFNVWLNAPLPEGIILPG